MRMDNLRAGQGIKHKSDNLEIVDPKEFQEEVKSLRTLSNAFKHRQTKDAKKPYSDNLPT
ncbi:hypothetical protein FBU30_003099 [Linnemannia zychae]|nr:hypothetical protein FBU30_003099 [Linnemannia zychae]